MSTKRPKKTIAINDGPKLHAMDKLKEWGERLPIGYRFTAIYIAIASGWFVKLSKMVVGGPMRKCLPYDTPQECLKLLRRHRELTALQSKMFLPPRHRNKKHVLAVLKQVIGSPALIKQLLKGYAEYIRELPDEELQILWTESRKLAREWANAAMKDVEDALLSLPEPDPSDQEIVESLPTAVILRFLLPCLFEYGEWPVVLLRRARQGDNDALEKLCRLGTLFRHDPRIARRLHIENCQGDRTLCDLVAQAEQNPCLRDDGADYKLTAAAFLIQLSILWPRMRQVTLRSVRDLFDAIAIASSHGKLLRDIELPESDDAFRKAVQRKRKVLPGLNRMWDKKAA